MPLELFLKQTRFFYSVFSIFCIAVALPSSSHAQLSQLGFDDTDLSSSEQIARSLVGGDSSMDNALEVQAPTFHTRARLGGAIMSVPLKNKEVKPIREALDISRHDVRSSDIVSGLTIVLPRFEGPFNDPNNDKAITSRTAWNQSSDGSCARFEDSLQVEDKSKAIKEILFRFTGTDDYYSSVKNDVCRSRCAGESETPVLSGVSFASSAGTSFRIEELGGRCVYRLESPSADDWDILEVKRVVCSCLPAA
jgi:hypothetical protein